MDFSFIAYDCEMIGCSVKVNATTCGLMYSNMTIEHLKFANQIKSFTQNLLIDHFFNFYAVNFAQVFVFFALVFVYKRKLRVFEKEMHYLIDTF